MHHPAFTEVHTDHDIRAPHGCGATSPVSAQPPTLRAQLQRGRGLNPESPGTWTSKLRPCKMELEGRGGFINTDSSAEEVGESLQDVERREERCDSKRLSNPAWLQSNSENFDCTSFTLLENIRTDCPHSSNLTFLPANQRCCPVQQTLSGWFKDDLFSLLISLVHPSFQVVSNITLHR